MRTIVYSDHLAWPWNSVRALLACHTLFQLLFLPSSAFSYEGSLENEFLASNPHFDGPVASASNLRYVPHYQDALKSLPRFTHLHSCISEAYLSGGVWEPVPLEETDKQLGPLPEFRCD